MNGTGKSTALKILAGQIKPNLGDFESEPSWSEIVKYYRGSDLQNYFQSLLNDDLKVATKPQLEAGFMKRLRGNTVRTLMNERDERGLVEYYAKQLDLCHLMDRNIEDLSGGEVQRFAAACAMCRDADVYMFDEVSSFLDVRQRLKVAGLIRDLVHGKDGTVSIKKKYVIVVEHDLAILDYMSDFVSCLYGSPGAYGVVAGRCRVRNGINQFLAGYIKADNMRFRDHELTFKVSGPDHMAAGMEGGDTKATDSSISAAGNEQRDAASMKKKVGEHTYPAMQYSHKGEDGATKFVLTVEAGSLREAECIVLLGENGCGKTTFMEMLAGRTKEQRQKDDVKSSHHEGHHEGDGGSSLESLGVSYKPQGLYPKLRRFGGTVRDIMEKKINKALSDQYFRQLVLKPLKVEEMEDLPVASLSGGEMQRLSCALCLGKSALFYLIDEPSAGLDCEQRVLAAKVMKRWVVNHLGRTLLVVEHDFVMATAMADRAIVYTGTPGVCCIAHTPVSVFEGFNRFLKNLDVTFRLDPKTYRPRCNTKGCRIDKEQRAKGVYYQFDVDEEDGSEF